MAERVGLVVPNLFVRVPVEHAVRAAGAEPVTLAGLDPEAAHGCRVVIVDLDAAGPEAAAGVQRLTGRNVTVLAFGPHVDAARLAAVRRAGALALPRSAFLPRLPELLAAALG